MKTLKSILGLSALLFAFSFNTLSAQDFDISKSTPEQRAKLQTEQMKAKLPLTAEQYDKVYAVNLKFATESQPYLEEVDSKMTKFRQLKAIQNKKSQEMKSVLTPEQYKKYEELQKENREKVKERYKASKK